MCFSESYFSPRRGSLLFNCPQKAVANTVDRVRRRCRPFSATRDSWPKTARGNTSSGAKRARESALFQPRETTGTCTNRSSQKGRLRDEEHGGCVPMRLDGNYPIGNVDPLIHSSAIPETPRSLATYDIARVGDLSST